MSELSLELILLQVILPAILEQKHTRSVIKAVIEYWILAMARLLLVKEEEKRSRFAHNSLFFFPPAQIPRIVLARQESTKRESQETLASSPNTIFH